MIFFLRHFFANTAIKINCTCTRRFLVQHHSLIGQGWPLFFAKSTKHTAGPRRQPVLTWSRPKSCCRIMVRVKVSVGLGLGRRARWKLTIWGVARVYLQVGVEYLGVYVPLLYFFRYVDRLPLLVRRYIYTNFGMLFYVRTE